MAKIVYKNAYLMVNTVDLSDHVRSCTLDLSAMMVEDTCMSDAAVGRLVGLEDTSMDVVFANDFAAAKVDATIWAVYDGAAAVAIIFRPDAGVKSATNPQYGGNAVLESYSPATGSVGDLYEGPVVFQGDGAWTRDAT